MKKRRLPQKPTVEAMQYIASSLRDKFNAYTTVQIDAASAAYDRSNTLYFWMSVENGYGTFLSSWKELINTFEGLMTGAIPNE